MAADHSSYEEPAPPRRCGSNEYQEGHAETAEPTSS